MLIMAQTQQFRWFGANHGIRHQPWKWLRYHEVYTFMLTNTKWSLFGKQHFQIHFLHENWCRPIFMQMSLKYVSKGPIDNKLALIQVIEPLFAPTVRWSRSSILKHITSLASFCIDELNVHRRQAFHYTIAYMGQVGISSVCTAGIFVIFS